MEKVNYSKTRNSYCLHEEDYNGWKIVIVNLGIHPCGYIGTTDKASPFWEKGYSELSDMEYYGDCHGGFTYGNFGVMGFYKDVWFLGWDYGHAGDYAGYDESKEDNTDKKWTTEEILKEAKEQVDAINALETEEIIIKRIKFVKHAVGETGGKNERN